MLLAATMLSPRVVLHAAQVTFRVASPTCVHSTLCQRDCVDLVARGLIAKVWKRNYSAASGCDQLK